MRVDIYAHLKEKHCSINIPEEKFVGMSILEKQCFIDKIVESHFYEYMVEYESYSN